MFAVIYLTPKVMLKVSLVVCFLTAGLMAIEADNSPYMLYTCSFMFGMAISSQYGSMYSWCAEHMDVVVRNLLPFAVVKIKRSLYPAGWQRFSLLRWLLIGNHHQSKSLWIHLQICPPHVHLALQLVLCCPDMGHGNRSPHPICKTKCGQSWKCCQI